MNEKKVESRVPPIEVSIEVKGYTLEQKIFVQAVVIPGLADCLARMSHEGYRIDVR